MRYLRSLLFGLVFIVLVGCTITVNQKTSTTTEGSSSTSSSASSTNASTAGTSTTLASTTTTTRASTTTTTIPQTTTTTTVPTATTSVPVATTTVPVATTTEAPIVIPPIGTLDNTYYASAVGLSGNTLKTTLHNIIDDNDKISYTALWEALAVTDRDPNNPNNIIEFYSGISISNLDHGGDVDQWNREHVWAKSHGDFGTLMGPGTDLFNIHPTDVRVNSLRNNLDFDNGGSGPVDDCDLCKIDGDSFEPRDDVKGDVARTLFYMAVRYEGDDGFADLELNDLVNNDSSPFMGKLSVLLQWNIQDPPDAFEQRRNEVIYEQFQHNRNPFIDHPEWVNSIWGTN